MLPIDGELMVADDPVDTSMLAAFIGTCLFPGALAISLFEFHSLLFRDRHGHFPKR